MEGFWLEGFSSEVPGARSLALGPKGVVFVGSRAPGRVYAVLDRDGDGRAEVLPDGSLLVSDDLAGAIYRIRYGWGKSLELRR